MLTKKEQAGKPVNTQLRGCKETKIDEIYIYVRMEFNGKKKRYKTGF